MKYIQLLFFFPICIASYSYSSESLEEEPTSFLNDLYVSSRMYAGDYPAFSEGIVINDDNFKYRLGGIFSFDNQDTGVELNPELSIEKKIRLNNDFSFYLGLGAVKNEPTFEYEMVYKTKTGFTLNTGYRFFLDDNVIYNRNQFYIGFDLPLIESKKSIVKPISEPIVKKTSKPKLTRFNIFFDNNSTSFKSDDSLLTLVEEILVDENAKVILQGFSNSIGNYEDNLLLSKKRALSVRSFLINNGVDSNKILVSGLGESSLILNGAAEDTKLSRRVVILYYSSDKSE